jgi:hypothetical protein
MIIKPGKYFIGDPCYAIPDDDWSDLLDHVDMFNDDSKLHMFKGRLVWAAGTSHGDGVYKGDGYIEGKEYSHSFPVDAGLIGITELLPGESVEERLGLTIEIKKGIEIRYNDGDFFFDQLNIDTDGSDDYDEDFEEE